MDPVKVEGILEWPTLQCKGDVQSFLGFCNFYRCFIEHFAGIARPLHVLTGNTLFEWTTECQDTMRSSSKRSWITPTDHSRLRYTIHFKVHERSFPTSRHIAESLHGLSP